MRIRGRDAGLWIGIPMLVVFATGLVIGPPEWRRPLLGGAAIFGAWPLVLDAMMQARFRKGVLGLPSLEAPGGGFIISGALASLCVFGLTFGEPDPEKRSAITVGVVVLPAISLIFAGWCLKLTWRTRRSVARLASATDVLEGSLSLPDAAGPQLSDNRVLAMHGITVSVTPSTVSEDTRREAPLTKLADHVDLHVGATRWKLVLAETEWLSLEHREDELPSNSIGDHGNSYDALTTSQQVLVCGTQRDGAITDGLLFAARVNAGVRPALTALKRRHRLTLGLGALGAVALVAAALS